MTCPNCSSDTWDNSAKVASGWKGPIRKCKDKDCGWVQWPPKKPSNGQAGNARPSVVGKHTTAPKWSWGSLSKTYERCLLLAIKHVRGAAESYKVGFTTADVLQATATLFIEACRSGVKTDPPQEQPLSERPQQLHEGNDEDFPF